MDWLLKLNKEIADIISKRKDMKIYNMHHLLDDNQFYQEETPKERIVLHHTAGGSARSSIEWWNQKPDRVSTPYLIDRNGDILETFSPKKWAYALGINSSSAEKKSIHIEIANRGWLVEHKGGIYYQVGSKLQRFDGEYVRYKQDHRGHKIYEKYTKEQVASVVALIDYLNSEFKLGIPGSQIKEFWHYDFNSKKKIISHTTLRKDKSDIHPQPDLIQAIYDYAGYKGAVTE